MDIIHVMVEGENGDHGQALGDVNLDKREPHGRLRNNAQRGHEKK